MKKLIYLLAIVPMCFVSCGGDDDDLDNGSNGNNGGKQEISYTSCPNDRHPHMIDLGLPSGTKWACCNVGASKPEDYGGYYAWGETNEKYVYSKDSYRYYLKESQIGYNISGISMYDVATAKWGIPWCMPSRSQIKELVDKTTSTWTSLNGVNGRKFTGSNGGTIFLPAAGSLPAGKDSSIGSIGVYWLCESFGSGCAYFMKFSSYLPGGWGQDGFYSTYSGHSVRPVRQD